MIAEITKTYARKGKASTGPSTKKDTPPVTAPIHHEPMNFSLEGELAKIKISGPSQRLDLHAWSEGSSKQVCGFR
jgi:hypothetical protein